MLFERALIVDIVVIRTPNPVRHQTVHGPSLVWYD
jgi:hypothetical protein